MKTTKNNQTPNTKANTNGAKGKRSALAGHKLIVLPDYRQSNPRRKGTHGYKSFELIRRAKHPLSYEEYVARGGRNNDLHWDIEHGFIKVK